MFFDRFPRYYETSEVGISRGRLNLRHEAIFAQNADVFEGARVLDIASHDGRWSLAALMSGATEVIGIEAREDLVAVASQNLARDAPSGSSHRFIAGDVFEVLARERLDVDVVLCLGFLYHTLRYNELLHRIRDLNPQCVLIDTSVLKRAGGPFVRLGLDRVGNERMTITDQYSYGSRALIGWPSVSALRLMLRAYGFKIERFSDWGALLRDNPEATGVADYAEGRRVTVRCVPTEPVTGSQAA
jgi:ubiquinone/menaquinone biosynthesis C-methylase UbiE